MAKVLGFLIRYFSNYYTLHRTDLAARAAPLDPRLGNNIPVFLLQWFLFSPKTNIKDLIQRQAKQVQSYLGFCWKKQFILLSYRLTCIRGSGFIFPTTVHELCRSNGIEIKYYPTLDFDSRQKSSNLALLTMVGLPDNEPQPAPISQSVSMSGG